MTAAVPVFPIPKPDAIRQSVTSLALVAMCAAGADGCHIADYQVGASPAQRYSNGAPLPAWLTARATGIIHGDGAAVVAYLLRAGGIVTGRLAYVFSKGTVAPDKFAILNRLAPLIEAVHALPHETASLASKISRLDAELAGIKIAERARGILADGVTRPESVDTIVRHVSTVLEGRHFDSVLRQLLPDMEEQIARRQILMEAKTMLETRHSLSEEQAYLFLRLKSRQTRRPLSEVAQELLSAGTWAREEPNNVRP